MQKWLLVTIGIVILVFGGLFYAARSSNNGVESVDGIQCNTMEQAVYHIHPHITIMQSGSEIIIPSYIGIPGGTNARCFYWIHTHDTSGIIHVESPIKKDLTFGNFLGIWKKTYGSTALDGKTFNVTVDGEKISDYNNIAFKDKQKIVVTIV